MSREQLLAAIAVIGIAALALFAVGESGRGLLISFGVDIAAVLVTALAIGILYRWLRDRN